MFGFFKVATVLAYCARVHGVLRSWKPGSIGLAKRSILCWPTRKGESEGVEEDGTPAMSLNLRCVPSSRQPASARARPGSSLVLTLSRKPLDMSCPKHCADRRWAEVKVGGSSPHSYCHVHHSATEILRQHVEIVVLVSFAVISARESSDKGNTTAFSNELKTKRKGEASCFPYIRTSSSLG